MVGLPIMHLHAQMHEVLKARIYTQLCVLRPKPSDAHPKASDVHPKVSDVHPKPSNDNCKGIP